MSMPVFGQIKFQSTPPVKAATVIINGNSDYIIISIHAAREGGDDMLADSFDKALAFQSTPPVKAATERVKDERRRFRISIHAAREGGDVFGIISEYILAISIHAAREGGDVDYKG